MLLPSLPPKKILKLQDNDEFLAHRMRSLTFFCEGLVTNPFLRHDNLWRGFMTEGAPIPTARDVLLEEGDNLGYNKWVQALEEREAPGNAGTVFYSPPLFFTLCPFSPQTP